MAVGFLNPRAGPKCVSMLQDTIFNGPVGECTLDSGFSFWVIQAPPTTDEITGICQSASCKTVVASMKQIAPAECVMRDGFFLYQDMLNPITTQCASTPPAAPVATTPAPTGEKPLNATWTMETPTPTPTSIEPTPVTWTTSTTAPSALWAVTPSTGGYTTTSSSNSDSTFTILIIIGCVVGAIVMIALFMWARQKNKRDPSVQREQHLVYGHEGAFDTMAPTPAMAVRASSKSSRSVAKSAHTATSSSATPSRGRSSHSNQYGHSINGPDLASIPLLKDEQITAVRVPLDKITVGVRISSGGFGEVYKGQYKEEVVAIKKLLPEHRRDTRLIGCFLCEVKLMATLEHARIVRFVGVAWETPTDICVLSEFMAGGDLRSMLQRSSEQHHRTGFDCTKLKIALHVAHALTYMHSLQPVVLHRDLKSANILLSDELDAKLTDFGVSRERGDATMTRGVGTSLWMAPEVMMGGRYDEKADVFSFGVVLSELDSNELPYASQLDLKAPNSRFGNLMQNVAQGRMTVEFSYESDPDIVALGRDCVSVDPHDRPSAGEALHRVHQVWRQYR